MDAGEEIAAVIAGERRYCVITADALEVLPTLSDGCIDMVLTDPPYNVSKPDATRGKMRGAGVNAGKFNFGSWDKSFDPSPVCCEFARVLSPNGQAYIFASSVLTPEWIAGLRSSFEWKLLTWVKPDPLPSMRQRHWVSASEHVLWFWRGKYVFNFSEHIRMYSWQMMQAPKQGDRLHPNQKPVDLVRSYILASSNEEDVILDPFCGSGTTLVAAIQTGRRAIGIEIDANYSDIARRRCQQAETEQREILFPAVPQPVQRTIEDMLEGT